MKYFSAFSGIGGFELGIEQTHDYLYKETSSEGDKILQRLQPLSDGESRTPWRGERPTCVGYSEIDKYAVEIYQKHFPEHKNYGDITKINTDELPDFDLLVGGFPCQAFSIAGKRRGFEDTRGTLFFELARILRAKQPRLFLFENVKGLLSHDSGKTFATIISTLNDLGYDLQWQVLNSKNHGVPQNRERVFIVGHLRGTSRPQVFPIRESNKGTIKISMRGKHQQDIVYKKDGILNLPAGTHGSTPHLTKTEISEGKIRRLTPIECERLQGFPDGWTEGISDSQRYKCLGNAVTVNVVEHIMEKLLCQTTN